MQNTHFLHFLHDRYSSHLSPQQKKIAKFVEQYQSLPEEEKKQLTNHYFLEGKKKLFDRDLHAFESFDIATALDPLNNLLWNHIATILYDHGKANNDKKTLLIAGKNLKIATTLDPANFDSWKLWGKILSYLSEITDQSQYLFQAREKFQKAIALSHNQSKETLADLYEDYGLVWIRLAEHSGEAVDIRSAIQAFRSSLAHRNTPSTTFWYHFGNAYFLMANLINDNRLFLKAIDYFKKGLSLSENSLKTLYALAEAYTQLYINTFHDEYFNQANHFFYVYSKHDPNNNELWLRWAHLLCEDGKINNDPKKFHLSIEKCVYGHRLDPEDPYITAQWVESLSHLGISTNRLDLLSEAEKKITAEIENYSEIPQLWYSYGICFSSYTTYYNDYDYEEEAIEKFQIGLSLDRTNAELWHALATSHRRLGTSLENEELLSRACKFYLKAIDLKPSCPAITIDYALTLMKLGELTENKHYLEDAIWQFETTIQTQKNTLLHHPEWLFHYGHTLDLLGKYDEDEENHHLKAVEIFHQVLLIDPTFPKIYFHLALALAHGAEYHEDLRIYEKAICYFRLAAKQDAEDDLVWLEWGLTLISLAQHTSSFDIQQQLYLDAERKLNRAGLLGNQHAFYYLGCLYSLLKRFNEAIHMLQKAAQAEILPDTEELLIDEWLEPLRQTDLFHQFLLGIESNQKLADER